VFRNYIVFTCHYSTLHARTPSAFNDNAQFSSSINSVSFFQGGYVWLKVNSKDEFDVPIGVKILGTEGKNIRIRNDNDEVCVLHTVNEKYHRIVCKPLLC
jgi:hypothetical protein